MRVSGILRNAALVITLAIPIPAISFLFSGVYLLPDPIGDGYTLAATPFLFFGLTITPLAIFLYFEANDKLRRSRNEEKLFFIEAGIYFVAIFVLSANFLGLFFFMKHPLVMGLALTIPPVLTLATGFTLLRETTPSEAVKLTTP